MGGGGGEGQNLLGWGHHNAARYWPHKLHYSCTTTQWCSVYVAVLGKAVRLVCDIELKDNNVSGVERVPCLTNNALNQPGSTYVCPSNRT